MNEVTWTVTQPDGKVTTTADKHPYVMPIKVPKDVDEKTKQFWDNYNSMQKKLMENGLMESK